MGSSGGNGTKGGATAGVLLAGAVSLLALPSAVLAFSTDFSPNLETAPSGDAIKTLESGDASGEDAPPPGGGVATPPGAGG